MSVESGEKMKVGKRYSLVFISVYLVLNCWISVPNVSAPPPPPLPDQFITEIFPNSTAPLQLSHTSTIITFNTTKISNKIDITFDANYTIANQENTTIIPLIMIFSLAINISEAIFEVFANNTPISHDLINISSTNEIDAAIDIQFEWGSGLYPIFIIISNVTLFKNSTSIMRYRFSGSKYNPFDLMDIFYMIYHIGTSQEWIGDTTGRVELRCYGKEPRFSRGVYGFSPKCQIVDITGGTAYICEWNNTVNPFMHIGVQFYKPAPAIVGIMETLAICFPFLLSAIGITIIVLIKIGERKKRESI